MENPILDQIIRHWKENFTGISALELANSLELNHEVIVIKLKELAKEGTVYVHETTLYSISLNMENNNRSENHASDKEEAIETLIAFPSRDILVKTFEDENMDYGVFTNRLHKGDRQVKYYYFEPEVLDKYFKYPNRYDIDDDIVEGHIITKDDYYLSLPEDKKNNETFGMIRYGKRQLKSGRLAISVIVHDLSELPKKDQHHWASFEIENPDFANKDSNYELYKKQNFEAEFTDYDDPLSMIYETILSINQIIGEKLFKNDIENPYLKYPLINSEKEYNNAHSELFKLIGRDSLNKTVLVKILKNKLIAKDEELLREDTKLEKGQWSLFKVVISKIPDSNFDPFQRCHDARTIDDHIITNPTLTNEDLTDRFRIDCEDILKELKKLESSLIYIYE